MNPQGNENKTTVRQHDKPIKRIKIKNNGSEKK